MPITIKTGTMKYKKPNGEYEAFNAVAQESTDAQIASIQSAGSTQISNIQSAGAATIASIPNDYTTLTHNVSQLSEEKANQTDVDELNNEVDNLKSAVGYVKTEFSMTAGSTHSSGNDRISFPISAGEEFTVLVNTSTGEELTAQVFVDATNTKTFKTNSGFIPVTAGNSGDSIGFYIAAPTANTEIIAAVYKKDGVLMITESAVNDVRGEVALKAGKYSVSVNWEKGNIDGTGKPVSVNNRARMVAGVKTIPNSVLVITNNFADRLMGVAINYYDADNQWLSQDASHWSGIANQIGIGRTLEIPISDYGYVRCSVNLAGTSTITDEMLTILASCFAVYTNEQMFDLFYYKNANPFAPTKSVVKIVRNNTASQSALTFVWMSDSHYQVNNGNKYGTPLELFAESAAVAKFTKSDFLVHTGDVVNGRYDVDYQESDLIDVIEEYNDTELPVYIIEGNHDDNSWHMKLDGDSSGTYKGMSQVLTNAQFTSYGMNNQINGVTVDAENPLGGYFYKDFPKAKLRVVCLNTTDIPYIENADHTLKYYGQWTMGFQEKQLSWLANKALKFSEPGWGVVFFMHYDGQLDDTLANVIDDPKNWYFVKQIIAAYKAKSSGTIASSVEDFTANVPYDFTNNPSNEVTAYFSGHVHLDQSAIIDGIPHMSIVCSFDDGQSGGYGFDIVTLDRANKVINTIRYNGGEMSAYNRHISWS